jgi:hypothetical protein
MANDAVTLPLGGPSISGTSITVDLLLNNPKRVQRDLANLVLQNFMVDQIFSPAGDVTGGAVIYDVATTNELYGTRDVQRVEPGQEGPIVTFDRQAPLTAQVEKFGGKFKVTDEARLRNQVGRVVRAQVRLANTIRRKTQQRALTELSAAVSTYSRTGAGQSWADAAGLTLSTSNKAALPGADFADVQRLNEVQELGYEYDTVILNPQEWSNLQTVFDGPGGVRAALQSYGITKIWITNRQTAGTAKFLASGMVGELGYEAHGGAAVQQLSDGIGIEQWRDKDGRQQDWYQASVKPVVYVTDPYAIYEKTGLAA